MNYGNDEHNDLMLLNFFQCGMFISYANRIDTEFLVLARIYAIEPSHIRCLPYSSNHHHRFLPKQIVHKSIH